MILIPQWVWVEVCDSESRKNYIEDLGNKSKVLVIDEGDYTTLVGYKEAELYLLFLYCCYTISRVISFFKGDIQKNRPVEDIEPYEEWLRKLYDVELVDGKLLNGRVRRKNAGEISISVLSYIISYYFNENVDSITIFSNDRDTYDFVSRAKEMLIKDVNFSSRRNTSITFKSNDFLIYEWVRNNLFVVDNIDNLVENTRQSRRIKFTRKKSDNSIEEQEKILDNSTFLEILKDTSIHIIF